jgi:transcriptional regulator with XRE-family HTH domain
MPRLSDEALARRLGARIRRLRLEAGVTQEKLAWSIDLDKGYMSQIESGRRLPSLVVLVRIAEQLGLEAADLLALELSRPRLLLLDAARRKDTKALHRAIERLGLK